MVFGKKGSGKTTFLAKTAYQYLKKGYPVFSTEKIPGVIQFDVNKIGYVTFPENAVILIDEVGMIWDNRNFKSFKSEVRDYFKYQRHEKHIVYLFSQTFDVDKKLRDLTDAMYLCTCKFGWLSIARKIKRKITLVHPQGDAESRIADDLEFEPLLWSLFGAKTCIWTFIPRWVPLFDSHAKLGLPLIESSLPYPIPSDCKKMFRKIVGEHSYGFFYYHRTPESRRELECEKSKFTFLNLLKGFLNNSDSYYDVFEDDIVEEIEE